MYFFENHSKYILSLFTGQYDGGRSLALKTA